MPATVSFVKEALEEEHDLSSDSLKIALYTNAATITRATTAYTATNEVTGNGYTAGGESMSGVVINTDADDVYLTANSITWGPNATFTFRKVLIYNTTNANKAVAFYEYGADQSVANASYTLTPGNTDATAFLRFRLA